jgi:hypothetical protein
LSTQMIAHQKKVDNGKSGWTITFLMIARGGGPSSGYVLSGFFGGKYLVTPRFLVLNILLIRFYFWSFCLGRGD